MSAATQLSDRERFDWLRLSRCENVGPRTFAMLLKRHGNAAAALKALPSLAAKNANGRVLRLANVEDIEAEFEAAERCGARFIGWSEPDYPWLLREIDSAPPMIAIRGNPSVFARPTAAIVGSRNASAAGLAFTERLARGLAEAGYVVVSGLARGIDARAHRATTESGTIAVLAGGHDKIYPADHEKLLEQLLERGAAISEMPFGWEARGRDFPRRNRIVSGLSSGIVVVEAAKNSGSLITARFAGEQGREVFAVPGSPLDPRAEGTNALLRDGATFCTRVEDVLDALAARLQAHMRHGDLFSEPSATENPNEPLWDELDLDEGLEPGAVPKTHSPDRAPAPYGIEQTADEADSAGAEPFSGPERIIGLLGPSPVSIDELVRAADMPAQAIRAILLELELAGRLERHGGNLVSLV
ncbi:DNA-processing protein DprA [Methyloferula stellata]|uniref:DNA-processing protein DprA n=1 Tax=Methyloferula stellata TaxID=876270 RepID=UPI0003632B7B|nr:DNA-processing protein DprA [Methyloferula stellata]